MENATHSSKRTSAAAAGGYRSKGMYDDVFGGPPKNHGGGPGLSPRVEDYREIFGGFHAPSSSRASIPVLNLPSSSYDDLDARAPSTPFEYADVFGGFEDADFAVSYDELVRMMDNGRGGFSSGDDEDDAWTMSEGECLSEGSNAKNRRLSDEDSCESANGRPEFNISYHKAGQSSVDLLNGITHVAQIPSGAEYSCVVDRSSSFSNTDDDYLPYKVNNGHLNADFSGEIVGGRLLRKTMSQPANGDGDGSMFGDDISSYKGYVRNGSFPNQPFVTITDVSLRTQPSDLPPPRRPPPALDVQKINLNSLQAERGGFDYEGDDGDGSLPYFDVVVDAGSSAAASAAAIKEAMEKAEAKLKSAKERMEKKKGVEQTHTKAISIKNSKDMEERVTQLLDESSTRRDERLKSSSRGQDFVVELPVSLGKQKTRRALHALPDSVDRKNDPALTKNNSEEKHGRESLSSEGSAGIDGDDEWKEANQYYELVKPEKLHRPFNQANVVGMTVSDFKLEKKGKSGMDGLEQVDLIMGLTRTKSKLEGNNARSGSSKLHQGLEKVLSVDEDTKCEENGKKVTVEWWTAENDAQDANELNGWFQPMKSQSEIKKTVKQKGGGLEPTKVVRATSKQNENGIRLAHEQAEDEIRVSEAVEHDEKEKKVRRKWEQEKNDKKQRQASRREENENKLQEAQLEGSNRRQKEVQEKAARDRTMKENREKEENGRKQKLAIEKEETEKRERSDHEREENEKRLKETIEKEEERRQQEIDRKQREAQEKQKIDKRLEREKKEQIIQEKAAREEKREYQERIEKEKRMRETFEREQNERRLNENQREEHAKRWQEATEKEEVEESVKQHILSKETGVTVEEGVEREENGRHLKAAKSGIIDLEEKETCNQEETVNKMHETHESEVADGSKKVMLNGHSQVELNHNASPSESSFDGINNLRDSRLPVNQKSRIGEIETRPSNDRNVGIHVEPRDTPRGSTLRRPELLNNIKSTDVLGRRAESGGRNEEGESLERSQVTSNREGITDNFMPARVVKDDETDKTLRKGATPHSAKVEVEESVQRPVPNAVPEQTAERKVKNLHTTMSSVQKEAERVKIEKELDQERLRKLEEEREREREREKDRMAVDKSVLEARANTEFREKAERAAVERIMNEARERLEKACAEARGKSLADKAPVDARFMADRAAAERAAAEARERAYQKAMADRARFDARDRMESSMPGNLSASSRIGVRLNSSNHTDGSYYTERSGVEGESPQRCKARLERHRRTSERAAKALAEKNMRDLIAQREQAERNRLAETLDADVKRWSSGKEGNLRALLSTLQYILGPDSGWQPVPLTEVITAAAVKKAYRKATLCVHPDKLQQRGASIQQKYICEKVFDLLKEAWNRFNSEER